MSSIISKIKFYLLVLIAFFIPGYIFLTPLCIVLFILAWVLEGNLKQKVNAWWKNKYALLFSGFYLLYVLWLAFTPDLQTGLFNIEVKLSLGIFPILLAYEGKFSDEKQNKLMWAFISGCAVNGIICLVHAIWKYYILGIYQFTYSQFSMFLHPSYYSMYIDLALLFIFYRAASSQINISVKGKAGLVFIAIFLLILLILLQSKAGMICTVLLLGSFLVKLFMNKTYRKAAIITLLGCIAIAAGTYYSLVTKQHSRFNMIETLAASGKMDSTSSESTQARFFISKAAKEVIAEKPFLGYGTGQAWGKLQEQYKKDGYTGSSKHMLNAHNQYLQCIIDTGFIGLICMLGCFIIPLIKAVREKRFVYGSFLCILLINMFVESMLEQQAGTMFYGLFNSILMFNFVI